MVDLYKYPFQLLKSCVYNKLSKAELYYMSESADWVIKDIGTNITKNLKNINSTVTITHFGIKNSIIHYGSVNTFLSKNRINLPHKSNKIIVTWFHIFPGDKRINLIPRAIKYVDIWHTSCNLTKNKLIKLGVPEGKIEVIPLGVDLNYFSPPSDKEKKELRTELNIPDDRIIIGSFQKDGEGWGEGLNPKLIKGPDVFCNVVEELSKKYDIFVVLTGPARGYVKKRLENANIPYIHKYLDNPNEVAKYYKVINLYLVTSREEGGPKAILESLASGVPLITTKVGMAPDIIKDGENGMMCDIEDIKCLINKSEEIINNSTLRNYLVNNGLKTIQDYDWKNIANKYYEKIYKNLLGG